MEISGQPHAVTTLLLVPTAQDTGWPHSYQNNLGGKKNLLSMAGIKPLIC
jgi:hypothetical protein